MEYQPTFKLETIHVIRDFLKLQREPICFVAHYGNFFDYPIFRAELHQKKMSLPEDILCIDSLDAFRELCANADDANVNNEEENVSQKEHAQSSGQRVKNKVPFEFTQGFNEFLGKLTKDEPVKNAQVVNETTPRKPIRSDLKHGDMKSDASDIKDAYYVPKGEQHHEEVPHKVRIINGSKQSSAARSIPSTSSVPSTAKKRLQFWYV